jgi:Tfp pilus assembly protein PilO
MNPILEKIKEWDVKYLYMLVAGIIAAAALLDFSTVMRLQLGLIASLDKNIKHLDASITELSNNDQRLAQFKAQLDLARKACKSFESMVYHKGDVPKVLKSISSIANDCGITLEQLMPKALSAKPLVENKDGKYYTMTIAIGLRGGYHRLGQFVNRMEQNRLFWQVDELNITADPRDPSREYVKMNLKVLILEK